MMKTCKKWHCPHEECGYHFSCSRSDPSTEKEDGLE